MSNTPQVTVVIDTYNYDRFVSQAIESALAQTLPVGSVEIIVVDDGSSDDTSLVVKKYAHRVRYIRKQNGGQASAFNVGVAAARGDVVCFLDADDYFYRTKLECVVEAFACQPDVGVLYNRYDVVDEDGTVKHRSVPANMPQGDMAGPTLLGYTSGCPTSGISVRRRIVARLNIPEAPFRISADHFYLNILPLVARVGSLAEPLHAYRVHGRNLYLGQPDAAKAEIHARQQDALWNYAKCELGKEFFRAEYDLQDRREDAIRRRVETYCGGLRYLLGCEAPALLRGWSACKLTGRFLLPPGVFAMLKDARDQVLGEDK